MQETETRGRYGNPGTGQQPEWITVGEAAERLFKLVPSVWTIGNAKKIISEAASNDEVWNNGKRGKGREGRRIDRGDFERWLLRQIENNTQQSDEQVNSRYRRRVRGGAGKIP
jgi:hypothetical protein